MLDREYEQHLQSSGSAVVNNKIRGHILWLIAASSIIVPAILYLNKLS
jgi:hypothetical protein